jgi:hypothetical protein
MAFSFQPKVVTNGLIFCFDPSNTRSYNGSGTNVTDLSSSQLTGSLTNGPTYSSNSGGTIIFDGTNDYIITNSSTFDLSTSANFTHCIWIRPSFDQTHNTGRAILDFTGAGPTYQRSYLRWEGSTFGFYYDIANNTGGSDWRTSPVPTFSTNTWNYLCFVHQSDNTGQYYLNGSSIPTTKTGGILRTVVNNPISIGYGAVNSYYWSGSISNVSIYNRTLSASEILQNYNALKGRFGLT